ncbi:E3 ubiquitin-protein ligase TRIM65 [Eleutherodactylus coqui]|uniref:E3 ubiquitin-protein ligase TRIM65 n=1 Tax=Eleutherodactylus coqui TaxID=57060 RepID=UPI0034627855
MECSICLEVFKNPLTLECGHSFCQDCIRRHWDQEEAATSFSCPDCRARFDKRPEPKKNVSLEKMVQEMKKSRAPLPPVQADAGAHSTAPTLCQRHHRALSFYCCTDSRCICYKCLQNGCRDHDWQDMEELSQQEKKKLSADLLASECQQKQAEEKIEEWKSKIKNIKDFHEKMVSGIIAKFEQVQKSLEECQILVVESVNCEKNAALTQVEEHVLQLQRHHQDLKEHQKEVEMLLNNNGVAFLESLPQVMPVLVAPESPNVQQCGNLQTEAVTKILPEVTRLLQLELPNLLHPENPRESSGIVSDISVNDTPRITLIEQNPCLHAAPARICTLRAQLYKDYRNLKFDPETANQYIEISEENCKATHKYRKNDVPDSPKRFKSTQVMCTEGFSEGSHYWEVGVSKNFVELGVAYESLNRSKEQANIIGRNTSSWSLQLRSMRHSVWHNDKETKLQFPMFTEIGIHLDLTAGSLTFYGVQDGYLQRLHSFSCILVEKVFPVFWIGEDVNVTIRTVRNVVMETDT